MHNFLSVLSKHKPGIFIGLGIGSMIMATVTGIQYAIDAEIALQNRREELNTDRLPPLEIVKTAGVYFMPSLVFTATGVALILSGNKMNLDRGAAAMTAYAISEATLRDYREKTRQLVGPKKEKDIQEAVAKDLVTKNPPQNNTIIITDNGDKICYDNVINQYFRSSKTNIETIINKLNYDMIQDNGTITLNEYCLALGLPEVELGTELGWDVNKNGLIKVNFTAKLLDNGEPCVVIMHDNIPRPIR